MRELGEDAPSDSGGDTAFDPATYGRSFADVYDEWYPHDAHTAEAVERISSLAGDGGRILELGVGTGRLAIPLAAAGHAITGMDASAEMLGQLGLKVAGAGGAGGVVESVLGDVGAEADWPRGPFDVVVAAFNLVFNLTTAQSQAACFAAAATALRAGGVLVVEAFVPAPMERRERRIETKEVALDRVVLIATDSDPAEGVVTGQHIELVDGAPVRLRPWRIRVAAPAELDSYARSAGLELVERHADWTRTPFDPHGTAHVSVYRRPR